MLEVCCGRGGWTKGFLAAGWRCKGIDITSQPGYPATFIKRDVMKMSVSDFAKLNPDFVCVSTPCPEFSIFRMRHFHKDPPFPASALLMFSYMRFVCEEIGRPFIMENVFSAQRFVGPAVFPPDVYKVKKGISIFGEAEFRRLIAQGGMALVRSKRRDLENHTRKTAAEYAEIPLPLALHVARHTGAF